MTWAAEGQWFRPSRFGFNGLTPRQIFKIHPEKNRICFRIFQSLVYLNRGELTKNPTVFEIWIEEMRVQSVRASRKNVLSHLFSESV